MLVSKKYESGTEPGTILSLKLVNGDELIAKLEIETTHCYEVTSPMTVLPTQTGVKLINAMFTVEPGKDFSISKDHVMMAHPAAEPVADHYREITTGIKTVRNESRIIV
jgi:uncharacterized protein with PhoU and TrkA domain